MFSAQGLPLGSDTLEYAWLIDMQAGGLTGRVTVPQVRVCQSTATQWEMEMGYVHSYLVMPMKSTFPGD